MARPLKKKIVVNAGEQWEKGNKHVDKCIQFVHTLNIAEYVKWPHFSVGTCSRHYTFKCFIDRANS